MNSSTLGQKDVVISNAVFGLMKGNITPEAALLCGEEAFDTGVTCRRGFGYLSALNRVFDTEPLDGALFISEYAVFDLHPSFCYYLKHSHHSIGEI